MTYFMADICNRIVYAVPMLFFNFSDLVLFLCLYGCMPYTINAMGKKRKSPTVTMVSIKTKFAGNFTSSYLTYKKVAKILQSVYFKYLLSCLLPMRSVHERTMQAV